tara:strand:- start:199 stop:894 length:696 start_codon:yes stop_codon:yes gene_type:complete
MAKIILQASSFKKNYTIETLGITSAEYAVGNVFTMEVKPKENYVVDAADFTSGFSESNIISINYRNSSNTIDFSNKVIVNITLSGSIALEGGANVIVFVPIMGIAKTVSNVLTFIDETYQVEGVTVFDKITGGLLKTSNITNEKHSKTYTVTGGPGESGVIMQKVFLADQGYYISTPPQWKIKSRLKSNYTVTSQQFKDDNGDLYKKVYEISYSFPTDKYMEKYNDKIIFN